MAKLILEVRMDNSTKKAVIGIAAQFIGLISIAGQRVPKSKRITY